MPQGFAGDGKLTDAADTAPANATDPPAPLAPVLELDIAPVDIARLLRSPALAAVRDGRSRTTKLRIVWHDTAGGDLAASGLAIAEQHGTWRLERVRPAKRVIWLPATPAPVLATALAPDLLGADVPFPLVPVAAFTGRKRSFPLRVGGEPARLDVLEGTLRGVAQDRPSARVLLAGPAAQLAVFARDLAQTARLRAPRAGLAAEALAVALGGAPAPLHLGAPHVPPEMTLSDVIALVIGHLAVVMAHWAPRAVTGETPDAVHQMRVAVRRLRSALAMFRRAGADAALRATGRDVKELATRLGAARDWDVFLAGTGDAVLQAFPGEKRIAGLLAAAGRKRLAAYQALGAYIASDAWHDLALRLALLPTERPWDGDPDPARQALLAAPTVDFATFVLRRQFKRVLAAGADFAALPPAALHEVRKQAKQLRYGSEFFAPLFPAKQIKRFVEKLVDLQAALGTVNDGTVAADLMAELEGGAERAFAVGVVRGYVAASSAPAAADAGKIWRKFTQASPFWD